VRGAREGAGNGEGGAEKPDKGRERA